STTVAVPTATTAASTTPDAWRYLVHSPVARPQAGRVTLRFRPPMAIRAESNIGRGRQRPREQLSGKPRAERCRWPTRAGASAGPQTTEWPWRRLTGRGHDNHS